MGVFGWIAALLAMATFGCKKQSATSIAVVGGTPTNLRPEIGLLTLPGSDGDELCTAELISPRFIATAAHCFKYATGPQHAKFTVHDTSGAVAANYTVDYSYSLAAKDGNAEAPDYGAYDIALARLTTSVPAVVATPTTFGPIPSPGSPVAIFGYGCLKRPDAGAVAKRFVDYSYGETRLNCPGDSGGPRVQGRHDGNGAIWAINSGYVGSGPEETWVDRNADASRFGPLILDAVLNLGGTSISNHPVESFPDLIMSSPSDVVAGDFNGDGKGDVAAVGDHRGTVPMAIGDGTGHFSASNKPIGDFAQWARSSRSRVVGDFDGDGDADLALAGGYNGADRWTTLPIAFSNADGTFVVTNKLADTNLTKWAAEPRVYAAAGDFDGDGDDDIALFGGQAWGTIPVAFSNRDGTFAVKNQVVEGFPYWAQEQAGPVSAQPCGGASTITERRRPTVIAGDFDHDGDDDVALAGIPGWTTIRLALSDGTGNFATSQSALAEFPQAAGLYRTRIVGGDFNGDGYADLAALGGEGWTTIDFALSNGGGGFTPAKLPVPKPFPEWATCTKSVLTIDVDASGRTDILLAGGPGLSSLPVAFLRP